MADLNPIHAWKRLMDQPNDNRVKTIVVALLTAVICAVFVSAATVVLRPIQVANRAAETQIWLEALLSSIPGMSDLLAASDSAALSTVVVNLDTGNAAKEVTPQTFESALQDPSNYTTLTPEQDIAGIGNRPDLAQIYVLRRGDGVELLILPVLGAGYNGPIEAMLAIDGDMRTIAGITITSQSETPGLGARIEEPAWQRDFAGTRFRDDGGDFRFAVARGQAGSEYEVDGITGATRTSNAISRMVRFWLGPHGYGPLLDAVRRENF